MPYQASTKVQHQHTLYRVAAAALLLPQSPPMAERECRSNSKARTHLLALQLPPASSTPAARCSTLQGACGVTAISCR